MQAIQLRKATIADLPVLQAFEQGIVLAERPFNPVLKDGHVSYNDLAAMLQDDAVDFVIAELDGIPVACGYARIETAKHYLRYSHHAWLGMMYVIPEYRGRGINAMIITALKKLVRSRGVHELRLEVFAGNTAAINAYRKTGFENATVQMRMAVD